MRTASARLPRARLVLEVLFALAFAGMCAVSTYGYLIAQQSGQVAPR